MAVTIEDVLFQCGFQRSYVNLARYEINAMASLVVELDKPGLLNTIHANLVDAEGNVIVPDALVVQMLSFHEEFVLYLKALQDPPPYDISDR